MTKTAFGEWKPWGGHRLWTAPEEMPRSYSPDNSPIEAVIDGATVRLAQPVEPQTGILKEMTVTLASTGTAVTIGHRLTNKGQWTIELAPWALTILNPGGAVILPQEPYRSHDEALLPVRQVTLWAYTDLSDPRWQMGPKFLRLKPDPSRTGSQKIGIANHQNWAGYLRHGTLFIKRLRLAGRESVSRWRREHRNLHGGIVRRARNAWRADEPRAWRLRDPRRALVPLQGREEKRRRTPSWRKRWRLTWRSRDDRQVAVALAAELCDRDV